MEWLKQLPIWELMQGVCVSSDLEGWQTNAKNSAKTLSTY